MQFLIYDRSSLRVGCRHRNTVKFLFRKELCVFYLIHRKIMIVTKKKILPQHLNMYTYLVTTSMWNIFLLSHKFLASLAAPWAVILCVCPGVGLSFVSHPWVTGKTSGDTRRTGNSNRTVCFLLKHICSRRGWNKHLVKSGTNPQTQNAAGVDFWVVFFLGFLLSYRAFSSFTISLNASDFRMPPTTRTPPPIQATNRAGPNVYL